MDTTYQVQLNARCKRSKSSTAYLVMFVTESSPKDAGENAIESALRIWGDWLEEIKITDIAPARPLEDE